MAEHNKISRRHLFAGFGLAITAGVAARVSSLHATEVAPAISARLQDNSYRLTEHIKKYYLTAKI
jgi:hypothetical protein